MYQPPNEPPRQPDPYQQQPPTQYPPYQQLPYSQPGSSTQQRPYYQPPYYQPPPVMFVQQLPSPKRHNGCLIAVAVLIAFAILGTIVNAISGTQIRSM